MINEPEWIFPFNALDVGESFFIPTLKPANLVYMIETGAKRAGVRVKTFITHKDGMMGVRTWRVR
jgi:ethanolamine utilization microcompartment shell protein EutL